ncbi:unnamed protein product [Trichobilharzia szidati]|nr:unnamed protein product [Trichobilharzia szidati]
MNCHILFVFKVGHSVYRKPKPVNGRTHHWRCYVDSWNPRYPLSAFVKKITFKLHNTFENPRQVVRQAPFAIEEDGFGTFQLQVEVAFLDCVTTFYYDLTLFDQNALHTYRTVQMDPAPEDWDRLIQLGGIAIPRTSNQCTVHEIVQAIQSYSDLESLHSFSFYPELQPNTKSVHKDKSTASTSKVKMKESGTNAKAFDYGLNYQAMRNELVKKSHEDHNFLLDSDNNQSLQVSSSSSSSDRLQTNQPLPQKHKKKLQLLHEAQLLLEKAQQSQNWAPVISPPPPPIQPPTTTNINSPEGSHPLSPDPSTWSSRLSRSRSSLNEHSDDDDDDVEEHRHSYESRKSPVVQRCEKTNNEVPVGNPSKSDPTKMTYVIDSNQQDNSAPKQRIVLKLSRSSCGSQLSVSSSHPLDDEITNEKLERKKHKKEAKKERRNKSSKSSPSKHLFGDDATTPRATASGVASDKNVAGNDLGSKMSTQNFTPEISSPKRRHSPQKQSSHGTRSDHSGSEMMFNSRKSGNKSSEPCSENENGIHNNAIIFQSESEKEDTLKHTESEDKKKRSRQKSKKHRRLHQKHYSVANELQQDVHDAFTTSDVDSLCGSFSQSTHSHLLLMDQKDNDYHSDCFPNDSRRVTPAVDYFGDELQQQRKVQSNSVNRSFPPPALPSSSNVKNFKYGDESSVISNQNPVHSAASDGGSSRQYDPDDQLTHSVIATSSELYEEDFDDFTPPSKAYPTYEELNKHSNDTLQTKSTDQECRKRIGVEVNESQSSLSQSKQLNEEKPKVKQSKNSKHKISSNVSNKLSSHSTVDFDKPNDSSIPVPPKPPKKSDPSSSSDSRQPISSLNHSNDDSVEVQNTKKSSVNKSKSHDKPSSKVVTATVNQTKQCENSPQDSKTRVPSKDKESKHPNKPKKNEKSENLSKVSNDNNKTSNNIPTSGIHKSSSKVLSSTETNKQTNNEVKERSSKGSSSRINTSNKSSRSNNSIAGSFSLYDASFMDAELSSLSSDSPNATSPSSSSSVTPPMLSDDTCHLITMGEMKPIEESRNAAKQLKSNEIKRGSTVTSQSSARELGPNVVHEKGDSNRANKKNSSSGANSTTTTTTTTSSTTTATTVTTSSNNKLAKDVNPNTLSSSTNIQTNPSESTKVNSHNLEVLFDRLIRLREPHLAIRMSEILLYYISLKSPDSVERKNKSNSSTVNNNNRAVKVIHEKPKLIAFDLRKLPTSCIEKLTALIKEDEEISKKQNQTCTPSKLVSVKKDACRKNTTSTAGDGVEDNNNNSLYGLNKRRCVNTDRGHSSGSEGF